MSDTPLRQGYSTALQGMYAVATDANLAPENPENAIALSKTISDSSRRSEAVLSIVEQWGAADPAAARKYVETSSDLSAESRQQALKTLDRISIRK